MPNQHLKKTLKIFVSIFVITIVVGLISTILFEKEEIKINNNKIVHFDKREQPIITKETGTLSIDKDNSNIAYISIFGLKKIQEKSISEFTIVNDSKTNKSIDLNVKNSNKENYKVESRIDNNKLKPGEKTKVIINTELIKEDKEPTTIIQLKIISKDISN